MRNASVFCLEKQDIYFKKSCVDFDFISLIHSYFNIHIVLMYQELYLQDSSNNVSMPQLHSENQHCTVI